MIFRSSSRLRLYSFFRAGCRRNRLTALIEAGVVRAIGARQVFYAEEQNEKADYVYDERVTGSSTNTAGLGVGR